MAELPHFKFPFNFVKEGGRCIAQETEQGTAEELFDCVHVIVRTQKGTRIENPDFGINQQEFKNKINLTQLQAEVLEWEPRANVVFSEYPDAIDRLIRHVIVDVHAGKTAIEPEAEISG